MKAKFIVLSQSAAAILVAIPLMGMGNKPPSAVQQALNEPVVFTYTRSDSPNVHIAIRSDSAARGWVTSPQFQQVVNILNELPADHLRVIANIVFVPPSIYSQFNDGQGAAGMADQDSKSIFIADAVANASGMLWLSTLRHEIGHEVEFHVISDAARQAWVNLHNASHDRSDYVSDYAATSVEEEDFAETYSIMSPRTFSDAVKAAGQGHTVLMSKMIFMASQFITSDPATSDYDGTIMFYGPDPSGQVLDQPTRVPYLKTSDMLRIGDFTFHLSGQNITSITDSDGNTIASDLSVPLVPLLWPKKTVTVVPPTNPTPAPVPRPTSPNPWLNPRLHNPDISGDADSSAGPLEAVGGGPGNYIPLTQGTANSELRNLQVNGIHAGSAAGTAVHGGTAVRIRSAGSSSSPSIIVDPPNSSADVLELP